MDRFVRDYSITAPVAQAIAKELVTSKTALGEVTPSEVDLAGMITGVAEELTMQGAPQLQINLLDDAFTLLDSGFWGGGADHGRLSDVEINYPVGSKYWWRLRQVSPKADFSVETYWIPRVVRKLMELNKTVKASRASRTRAEFLKMLCDRVPEIRFHCKQLDVKQPIENPKPGSPRHQSASAAAQAVGLTAKSTKGLTVAGKPITSTQRDTAGLLLQVADRENAGAVATEALVYAGIWESRLSESANNGRFWGVLSGSVQAWKQDDTVGMAKAFLRGGNGFQAGGAIALSHSVSNPIEIAVKVEVPSIWPSNAYAAESGYPGDQKALEEVRAIIQAGGGATGTGGLEPGVEKVQQYNFETGTADEPHQDYWTAMNRLAQEVNWELVVDGPDIYYDSDTTLCRKLPVDVLERTDDNVADWSFDWDEHQIVTNMTLVVVCPELGEEGAYTPPAVLQLKGFGPASEGSTIGLPGRWLIGEVQRNPGDIVATLTLVQPTKPLKEPAPKTEEVSVSPGEHDASGSHALPLPRRFMSPLGRTDDGVDIENAPDGTTVYSMTNGICTAVASDPAGFGPNYPVIEITEGDRKGKCIYYGHVAQSLVKPGEKVAAGQPIAIVGHTGDAASLGHGHIEIGFSDRNGNPVSHHTATVATTTAGAEMREYLIWLCAMFNIKAS